MLSQHVIECQRLLDKLFPLIDQLRLQVDQSTGYVFYQEDNDSPILGSLARDAISNHLGEMRYHGIEQIGTEPRQRFMALAIPTAIIPLLQEINQAKKELQLWHETLAKTQANAYAAAQLNRSVLKRAQEPLLNLQMAERAIIVLNGSPTRLSWHYNTTSNSRRKTLGDALQALERLADKLPDYRIGDIESVRNRLASLPLNTPVAYRPSKPITHLKCQYRFFNKEGISQRGVCYAKNPIFYPDTDSNKPPVISLPAEIQGKELRKGVGRPSLISDRQVSQLLPNWFWYKTEDS